MSVIIRLLRPLLGLVMLLTIAMVDIRLVMRYTYLLYAVAFALLIFVEARGVIGGGAQR